MRPLIDTMKGGFLFRRIEVKYDVIGQRYKLIVRKFWVDFYSRRDKEQYGVAYKDIKIFVSIETPLVDKVSKLGVDAVVKNLETNWKDILEYAIGRDETKWITFTESEKMVFALGEKEKACEILDVTLEEFETIRKLSPYS